MDPNSCQGECQRGAWGLPLARGPLRSGSCGRETQPRVVPGPAGHGSARRAKHRPQWIRPPLIRLCSYTQGPGPACRASSGPEPVGPLLPPAAPASSCPCTGTAAGQCRAAPRVGLLSESLLARWGPALPHVSGRACSSRSHRPVLTPALTPVDAACARGAGFPWG